MRPLAILLMALAACGGASSAATETEMPEIDSGEAEKEAKSVIAEIRGAIQRGSPQGMLAILSEDIFVAGPGGEASTDRSAIVVALTDRYEGAKHKVKSRGLHVVAGPGGHSAWATEEIEVDGTTYAATWVLVDVDDIWVASAVHVARPVGDRAIENAGAAMPKFGPLPAGTGGGADAAKMLSAALDAERPRAELASQLADRKDVTLVGNGPKEVVHGATKITKVWDPPPPKAKKKKKKKKKKNAEPEAAPPPGPIERIELDGTPLTGATPDGALAWVCANVTIGEDGQPAVPHRIFYIYERGDAGWQLVAAHEAVLPPK